MSNYGKILPVDRVNGVDMYLRNTLKPLLNFNRVYRLSDISDNTASEYNSIYAVREITDRQSQLHYEKFFNEVILSSVHEVANKLNDAFKEKLWMSTEHASFDDYSRVFECNGIIGIVSINNDIAHKKMEFNIGINLVRP